MKNILLSSLVVVSLIIGSANMFAMKAGDASKVKALIASGKATEQTLAAFAKVPGKLQDKLGISDADYKAWLVEKGGGAPVATGEAVVPLRGEAVQPKTTAVAPKVDRNAIIKEILPIETAYVIDGLIIDLLRHPLLGTNKEDALAAIESVRKALVGQEQDPRIQALPTRAQFFAQMQAAPKRDLTYDEANFLTKAANLKKSAEVYDMYLQLHPDITFDDEFLKLIQEAATGKIILLMLDYSKFKLSK